MGLRRTRLSVFLLASALLGTAVVASPVAHAATFTVINNDGAGEGFNDPTPTAPVGGNTGTTLGAQRLIAFQRAADIWGGLLSSAVTIRVGATFDPLSCNASGAILGSAGPTSVFRDFAGALLAATWYPLALANALSGSDLDPGGVDITAHFNSSLGTTCPFPKGWYYGLDGNAGSDIDFVTVLLHELGHGLGFLTIVDLTTGAKALGFNDTFMLNLEDHGASPADYPSMTNAQRVTASKDTGNLHWVGALVRAASGVLTAGKVGDHVRMFAPNPQQSGSSVSHWDTALTPNQLMEPIYTVPLDPGLELPLFQDIGWTLLATSPSAISVTPSSQDFGNVVVGSFADSNFTVQNTGGGTLTGTASTSAPFSTISGAAYSLGPAASQIVTVRFNPTSAATFATNVTFTGGGGATRAVSGAGVITAAIEDFVTRFYVSVLERSPDPAGLAAWTNFLQAHCNAAGFNGIAVGFFDSAEFRLAKPQTLTSLVTKLYDTFLGRSPEPAGLAAWVAVFRQARLLIATQGFIPSAEFQSILPNPADGAAVANLVTRFYTQVLQRAPEPAGLAAWVAFIQSTGDFAALAQGFLLSPEFESRALIFRDYITILYRTFLGREPDGPGLDAWELVLRTKLLEVINTGFVPSPEFQSNVGTLCGT